MLANLDDYLLTWFERFSHWTQRTFGLTSVFWEKVSHLACVGFTLKSLALSTSQLDQLMWLVVICHIGRFSWLVLTNREGNFPVNGTANPWKCRKKLSRPAGIIFCCFVMYADLRTMNLWFEFAVVAGYFMACDDLPPGTSKIKQFLQRLSSATKPATSEA